MNVPIFIGSNKLFLEEYLHEIIYNFDLCIPRDFMLSIFLNPNRITCFIPHLEIPIDIAVFVV